MTGQVGDHDGDDDVDESDLKPKKKKKKKAVKKPLEVEEQDEGGVDKSEAKEIKKKKAEKKKGRKARRESTDEVKSDEAMSPMEPLGLGLDIDVVSSEKPRADRVGEVEKEPIASSASEGSAFTSSLIAKNDSMEDGRSPLCADVRFLADIVTDSSPPVQSSFGAYP
jgi:hypothetical protein